MWSSSSSSNRQGNDEPTKSDFPPRGYKWLSTADEEKVERLLEHVSSPPWHHPISTFMDRESIAFDADERVENGDDEEETAATSSVNAKQSQRMVVFGSYRRLIDKLLREGEMESGLTESQSGSNIVVDTDADQSNTQWKPVSEREHSAREMLLKLARQTPAAGQNFFEINNTQDIINVFHMYDSYKFFRQKMSERNVELQLEVLELIEREHGKFPDELFFQPISPTYYNAQREEDDLAKAIELSKIEYEKEVGRNTAKGVLSAVDESKHADILRLRRDQLLQQLVQHQNTINEEAEDDCLAAQQQPNPTSILFMKQNSVLKAAESAVDAAKIRVAHLQSNEKQNPTSSTEADESLTELCDEQQTSTKSSYPKSNPISIGNQSRALDLFANKRPPVTNASSSVREATGSSSRSADFERRRQFLLQQREKLVAVRAAKRDAELQDLQQKHTIIQGKPTTLSQASEAHQALAPPTSSAATTN